MADQRRVLHVSSSHVLITEDTSSVLITSVNPVSVRCMKHFQESLNSHDKIIPHYTLQSYNLECPLLNSVPPSRRIPKLPAPQLRLIDMFQEKRHAVMMSILGTLNPYQMAGKGMI